MFSLCIQYCQEKLLSLHTDYAPAAPPNLSIQIFWLLSVTFHYWQGIQSCRWISFFNTDHHKSDNFPWNTRVGWHLKNLFLAPLAFKTDQEIGHPRPKYKLGGTSKTNQAEEFLTIVVVKRHIFPCRFLILGVWWEPCFLWTLKMRTKRHTKTTV